MTESNVQSCFCFAKIVASHSKFMSSLQGCHHSISEPQGLVLLMAVGPLILCVWQTLMDSSSLDSQAVSTLERIAPQSHRESRSLRKAMMTSPLLSYTDSDSAVLQPIAPRQNHNCPESYFLNAAWWSLDCKSC